MPHEIFCKAAARLGTPYILDRDESAVLMVSWRQTTDASGHHQGKETSKPLNVPETTELNMHNGIIVECPDGHSHTITGMTVKRLNERTREKKNVGCGKLWQGSKRGTVHKIWVAQRVEEAKGLTTAPSSMCSEPLDFATSELAEHVAETVNSDATMAEVVTNSGP